MDGTTLTNLAGITLNGNWVLPIVGIGGAIQNTDTGDNGFLSTNGNVKALKYCIDSLQLFLFTVRKSLNR